jgi:hypothetical protein
MTTYDLYQHPRTQALQAVKQGFCWPAFFFLSFWCFTCGMFLRGFVLLLALIAIGVGILALGIALEDLEHASDLANLILILVSGYVGWAGNEWRSAWLVKNGFVPQGSREAASAKAALQNLA